MKTIFFDGIAIPNPGVMFACVKLGEKYRIVEIGGGTINIAEWSALLWALYMAREAGLKEVELIGDSQLAINQATGNWKVRHPTLKIFKEEFDRLTSQFNRVSVNYQPRLQNCAALHLEDVLLAGATIGPPSGLKHIDYWPPYIDVRTAINMMSG